VSAFLPIRAALVLLRRKLMKKSVLLVEPGSDIRAALCKASEEMADVQARTSYEHAFPLLARPFDFIVSNLRLGDYNGLQLVYRTLGARNPPLCIVYTAERNDSFAREVQRAGAFYETAERLPVTLAGYLAGHTPDHDRRDPATPDRRSTFRGGRRRWDQYLSSRAGV
jgi:DNA-binding NtrC family response regulator